MNEEKLNVLRAEVQKITNKIIEYNNEIERLDTVRDVLQREIELYEPIKQDSDLPF